MVRSSPTSRDESSLRKRQAVRNFDRAPNNPWASSARALAYTFKIAREHARIKRLYLFQWTGSRPSAHFDAGLMNARYKPRPGYVVVCRELHAARCKRKDGQQLAVVPRGARAGAGGAAGGWRSRRARSWRRSSARDKASRPAAASRGHPRTFGLKARCPPSSGAWSQLGPGRDPATRAVYQSSASRRAPRAGVVRLYRLRVAEDRVDDTPSRLDRVPTRE